MSPPDGTIVMATRDRASLVPPTLERLLELPERWPIIVVDDASTDGTAGIVRRDFPDVHLIELGTSRGACARNVGVEAARTELVAFADDDSWYAPGALRCAAGHFAAHSDLGLLAARCIVEPDGTVDPVSEAQASSPLTSDPPGKSIMGFLACTAVVRRQAFLDVGGFSEILGFVGEEELLAMDLRTAGWRLVHTADVVAHHQPGQVDVPRTGRRRLELRNHVLAGWLRRPLPVAFAVTAELVMAATRDRPGARQALTETIARLPRALADRRLLPADVEADIRALEASHP